MSIFGWKSKKEKIADEKKAAEAKSLAVAKFERDVYASMQYYRLHCDFETIVNEMEKNQPIDVEHNKPVQKFFADNFQNPIRRGTVNKLSAVKSEAEEKLRIFNEEKREEGISVEYGKNAESMKAALNRLFADDKNGLGQALYALRFAFDDTQTYVYEKESLAAVSRLMFDDENRIAELYADFKNNYATLSRSAPVASFGTGILLGLGVMSLFSAVVTRGVFLAGAAAGYTDGILSYYFGCVAPVFTTLGVGSATANTVLASLVILGSTAGSLEAVRLLSDFKTKNALRSLDTEEYTALLAVKATLAKDAKRRLGEEEFKNVLDEYLNIADTLRADAEYMMIVEKSDAVNAKNKIRVTGLFVDRLSEIVGI